ncbi:MAG: PilN domain-containing protein [Geitlerinemataceae cyanobacterium]
MYSIDINFLDDRPEYNAEVETSSGGGGISLDVEGQTALIIGAAVAIAPLALVGVGWLYLTQVSIPQLKTRQQELDAELVAFQQKEQELAAIKTEETQIEAQTQSLAGVFNFVTPWSAVLQDLRDRTPPGVRIDGVVQTDLETGAAIAAAPAEEGAVIPTVEGIPTSVTIRGIASSFSDVNDFLVVLQQSNFFEGSATRLLTSETEDNPSTIVQGAETPFVGELGTVVQFQIETQLSPIAAASMLGELEAKGAAGLVNRIRRLQARGVIE